MVIVGYLLAMLAAAVVAPILSMVALVITVPLIKPFRPLGRATILYNFMLGAVSMSIALFLFVWAIRRMRISPSIAMLAIPMVGVVLNDLHRIKAARERRFLSGFGEFMAGRMKDDIDFEGVLWGKYGHLCGDTVGFLVAGSLIRGVAAG